MTDTATTEVSGHARSVPCDGGGGALGHPRVFLEIDRDGKVCCPYCSRRYALDAEGRIVEVTA